MLRTLPILIIACLFVPAVTRADDAVAGHLLRIQYQEHAIADLRDAVETCRTRLQAIKDFHESVDPEDSKTLTELRVEYDKILAARGVYNTRLLASLKSLAGEHKALAGKVDPKRALTHRSTAANLHFQRGRIYNSEGRYHLATDKLTVAGKNWEYGNKAYADSQKEWLAALGLHKQVNDDLSDREIRRMIEKCFNNRVECLQNAKSVYKHLHDNHATTARSEKPDILSKKIGADWQKAASAHQSYQRIVVELGKISLP